MHKLPKIVLVLIVLMVVFSPFMQLDSWDRFPVGSGDFELHVISVLFETGMFFVFAGILSLFPALLRSAFLVPSFAFAGQTHEVSVPKAEVCRFTLPLRI